MPNINDMRTSKFLKKSDLGDDGEAIFTIRGVDEQNVGTEENPETKWVLLFREPDAKPMVLNWTNKQLAAKACGSEETDDWVGRRILVWFDDAVMFRGEMKGGLRIRKAPGAAPARKSSPPPEDDAGFPDDKDVPF